MKLIIFVDPLEANAILTHDSGWSIVGMPITHSSGRPGLGFTIPNETPNGHGCSLLIRHPNKVSIRQRAVLWLNESDNTAILETDDFILQNEKICPELPIPIPPIPEPVSERPIDILNKLFEEGDFNLASKEGCGQFTEAGCDELRKQSTKWGHIKKFGAQNQYHKHAIDALMLLESYKLESGETIQPGVYDIIKNSENPAAEPAFNFRHGPQPELWHYPPSIED